MRSYGQCAAYVAAAGGVSDPAAGLPRYDPTTARTPPPRDLAPAAGPNQDADPPTQPKRRAWVSEEERADMVRLYVDEQWPIRALPIPDDLDDLERARRVWIRLTQGRGGHIKERAGWRYYETPRGRGCGELRGRAYPGGGRHRARPGAVT